MPGNVLPSFNSRFQFWAFFGLLISSDVVSQISLDSKLSALNDDLWVSRNGYFALGFFNRPDQPDKFSVGIRFNSDSIPIGKRTVVWVAGGDASVGCNSSFRLMPSGELVLYDSTKGHIVWTSKTSSLSVSSVVLRDNGNLVMLTADKKIAWQSFDTPSDTLLPSQNLSPWQTLRAASRNSMSSYYTLSLNDSGHLQLKWEMKVIYWASEIPSGPNSTALLSPEGALRVIDHRSRPSWSAYGVDHNDRVEFRFLRLDVDGNLRIYSWAEPSGSWVSVWQAVENQCDVFATCNLGGVCMFNSSGSPVCNCPFVMSTELDSACLLPFQPKCTYGTFLIANDHLFLYGIYPPNDTLVTCSLEQCKTLCFDDPFCTAVTYSNDGTGQCRVKKTKYVSGQFYSSLSSVSFVKACSDPVAVKPVSSSQVGFKQKPSFGSCTSCQIAIASATLVAFVLIQIGFGFFVRKRMNSFRKKNNTDSNPTSFIVLSYTEIEKITGNFGHEIEPDVFKGTFPDKRQVLIGKLGELTVEEKKFKGMVGKIGSIRHRNLLKIEGYSCDSADKFLVYEFPKNGSLQKCMKELKVKKKLSWAKRFEICLSIARAVSYLHSGCREFFSHGNLSCKEVVLDELYEPKLIIGFELGACNAETDVKCFGKIIIALVMGCVEELEDACMRAYEEWAGERARFIVDVEIREGHINVEELERTLRIAFWCIQCDERMRPSMGEVVKVLEGILVVDPPPSPFVQQMRLSSQEISIELE